MQLPYLQMTMYNCNSFWFSEENSSSSKARLTRSQLYKGIGKTEDSIT